MTTITVDIDVDQVLDDLTTKELIGEMELRGYQCKKDDVFNVLTSEEIDILLQMLRDTTDYESRRIYDKLLNERYG